MSFSLSPRIDDSANCHESVRALPRVIGSISHRFVFVLPWENRLMSFLSYTYRSIPSQMRETKTGCLWKLITSKTCPASTSVSTHGLNLVLQTITHTHTHTHTHTRARTAFLAKRCLKHTSATNLFEIIISSNMCAWRVCSVFSVSLRFSF